MPRRRQHKTIEWLRAEIDSKLRALDVDLDHLTLREKVLRLVEILARTKDLGVRVVREAGIDADSAVERLRLYLIELTGIKIAGDELEVVGGISEYARRIRQLRVEEGYQIASGASADPETEIDLKPDEYLLVTGEPDLGAARRWHIANRVRRMGGSVQSRILQFFRENVGKIVTTEELAYVAKDRTEFGRRARELRTEQGYAVATRYTGRPDLKSGQYVLESLERIAEPHDRQIPHDVQKDVYQRDSNTCRLCGWNREKWSPRDPRILELHHLQEHRARGKNVATNLIVICSRCHDEVHAGRLEIPFSEA